MGMKPSRFSNPRVRPAIPAGWAPGIGNRESGIAGRDREVEVVEAVAGLGAGCGALDDADLQPNDNITAVSVPDRALATSDS
jgi:hypothetical protein